MAASFSDITPLGPRTKIEWVPNSTSSFRTVDRVVSPVDTSDGAGVSLKRSIGGPKIPNLDPFLLLDEFKSDDPSDYEAGFPEHPHRGFETVTIMLHGSFKHQDSRGNTGFLTSGGVQWMTAGKGVLHSETPMQADGLMWGYQLWVNLPAREKMKDPRYQDIDASKIPAIELGDTGVVARLIAGKIGSVNGAVDGIPVDPLLMDVMVPANGVFEFPVVAGHTLFVYTVEGNVTADGIEVPASRIILFNADGYSFKITASPTSPSRLLVVAGAPIKEPIARHGPFVMNTREEIIQCFIDLQNGKLA